MEQELVNDLHTKHVYTCIKFENKYSKKRIEFLDKQLYKEKNDHLQTTLYNK